MNMETLPKDPCWKLKMVLTPVQPEADLPPLSAEEVRQQVAARMPEIREKLLRNHKTDLQPVVGGELGKAHLQEIADEAGGLKFGRVVGSDLRGAALDEDVASGLTGDGEFEFDHACQPNQRAATGKEATAA